MPEFIIDVFSKFNDQWALLTAGCENNFNSMTIRWGGMGTVWGRPVITVYVKPIRFTYEYMESSDYFTVSFYSEEYRHALGIMGSRSGRDCDKIAISGLTPRPLDNCVSFAEAEETIVCRKIYSQDMVLDTMPADVIKTFYETESPHRLYIGEVVDIFR